MGQVSPFDGNSNFWVWFSPCHALTVWRACLACVCFGLRITSCNAVSGLGMLPWWVGLAEIVYAKGIWHLTTICFNILWFPMHAVDAVHNKNTIRWRKNSLIIYNYGAIHGIIDGPGT